MSKKESRRAMRRLRIRMRFDPKFRAEYRAVLAKRAAAMSRPWYGDGVIISHLVAYDVRRLISICGRPTHSNSTTQPVTLLGAICPRCVRLWNRAVDDVKSKQQDDPAPIADEAHEVDF